MRRGYEDLLLMRAALKCRQRWRDEVCKSDEFLEERVRTNRLLAELECELARLENAE